MKLSESNRLARFVLAAAASAVALAAAGSASAVSAPPPGPMGMIIRIAQSVTSDVALSHRSDFHSLWCTAGETARISLRGNADTDIDLFVRAPDGRIVCREVGWGDREGCYFIAPQTGVYRVEVRNLGDIVNVYDIENNR